MVEVVARTPEFQLHIKTQCRIALFNLKTIGLEHYNRTER